MQREAVIPNFFIHEHHQPAPIQDNIDGCKYGCQPQNGCFSVPDRPGVGQELTGDCIARSEVSTAK